MSPRLLPARPSEVIRVLLGLGFIEKRQTGSHKIFRHPTTGKIIPVPVHAGTTLKTGTLLNIIKQSGLTKEEFLRLLAD